jgi:hypothetical protein
VAEWRYIATRLHGDGTEDIIHPDLPLEDVSLTEVISGPNGHSSKISPALGLIAADDGFDVIEPWSTAIYAEADGAIQHGCIVTDRAFSGPDLSITGAGFTAAIKDQPYSGGKFFVETDPIDIVRHVWAHWQGLEGGNLGLVVDAVTKAGLLIGTELKQVEFDTQNGPVSFEAGPVKLNDYSTDDLGGFVDKLAQDYPFDYVESHRWNATRTAIEHHLDFAAPRFGRRRDDLIFQAGANLLGSPEETDASESYASAVLVRGAGDGPSMKRKLVLRAGEKRLRRVMIHTDNTIKTDSGLLKRGTALLNALKGSNDVTEVLVRDSELAPLRSWKNGDEIQIQTDSEWTGEGSIWVRVLSTTINPDDLEVARLAVIRADKVPS